MESARPSNCSWIYAAASQAAREAASTPCNPTRLMLVFSDGFDTSTARPEDAADLAHETGIAAYPVVLAMPP